MKKLNIYLVSSIKGPRNKSGYVGYTIEYLRPDLEFNPSVTRYEKVEEETENRSEMMALIKALKHLRQYCELSIYTDCGYLYYSMGHVRQWMQNNWRNAKNEQVKNEDLWKQILTLLVGQQYQLHIKEHHSFKNAMEKEVKKKKEEEKCLKNSGNLTHTRS